MSTLTQADYEQLQNVEAEWYHAALQHLPPEALSDPDLAQVLGRKIGDRLRAQGMGPAGAQPADGGLADLIGLGTASANLGQVPMSTGVVDYDDTLTSDRILAAADLYYICIHERIGVFRVMNKLQELFRAGTLRISNGEGALGLYRFDKRGILRYGLLDRMRAYKRVFGYTNVDPGQNARANGEFHGLFSHFIGETAKFWRDKRISEVIRDGATDPTFAAMAIVRRSGLDLRNNLKNSAYGYINVLRVETSQALADAFKVLEAADIRSQFGAENAWDLIELVMWQYFHRSIHASTMNRMAVSGRDILQWLAQPYVLTKNRHEFETFLNQIAEAAEEWISSEEGMRMSRPTPPPRNVYMPGPPPVGARRDPVFARSREAMPV